ncbi:MAG: radical SAM protein [Photobacterium halotolerans]
MSDQLFKIDISPSTLSIITTYQCTAACADCCFECSPSITKSLSYAEMSQFIDDAIQEHPSIRLVVFTGGECFMLKEKLFSLIAKCTQLGLATRCVTNGYWAKRPEKAMEYAQKLKHAGVNEINLSTGLDHQQWVPENTIVNAVIALVSQSIFTLVTLETDTQTSDCFESFHTNPKIKQLQGNDLFELRVNSWMSFHETSEERALVTQVNGLEKGCDNLFDVMVATPDKEITACCGLTVSHIREMKLSHIQDIGSYKREQEYDFLKLWIKIDGPYNILKKLIGDRHERLDKITHPCQACAIIHNEPDMRERLIEIYPDNIVRILNTYNLIKATQEYL